MGPQGYSVTSLPSTGPLPSGGLPSASFTRPPSRLSIAGVSGVLHPFPAVGSPPAQLTLHMPATSPAGSMQQQQQRRRTTIGAIGLGTAFAASAGAVAAAVATGAGPTRQAGVRQSEQGCAAAAACVYEARSDGGGAAATCDSAASLPLQRQVDQAAAAALAAGTRPSLSAALNAFLRPP
eukprot:XP_001697216.1 predicted protein [Chlamydomonas reinhardtii]